MSLIWLFNSLFWDNYNNLDYNYYKDILSDLTENEIKNIKRWLIVKKNLFIWNKKIYYRLALPRTQQNNWNISCFITLTQNQKRMSYHWIFYQDSGNTRNYWIRKYKHLWKNDLWYDDFEGLWEECFWWHWGLYDWNMK